MRANQQQAQTLKELGYVTMYMTDMSGNRFGKEEDYYPTLVQIVDWLREHKGLHVYVYAFHEHDDIFYWVYSIQILPEDEDIAGLEITFYTHNEALSAAITKALTILKETAPAGTTIQ